MTDQKTAAPFSFRLRPEDLARLDAAAAALDEQRPGVTHTRVDVVRIALAYLAAEVAPTCKRGAP
jgi:hypothetical protein